MKCISIISLFILGTTFLQGQDQLKSTFYTTPVNYQTNQEIINGGYYFKTYTSIGYERFFGSWRLGLNYSRGFNKIKDKCDQCPDAMNGTGYLKENNFFLVNKYNLFNFLSNKIQFFGGIPLFYSSVHYQGDFYGGFGGGHHRIDRSSNIIGLAPEISLEVYPKERIYVSLRSSFRFGWGKRMDNVTNKQLTNNSSAFVPVSLRIGVLF